MTRHLAVGMRFSPSVFFFGCAIFCPALCRLFLWTQLFPPTVLPPIVFAAGWHLKKKAFFKNILAINMFAVLGTVVRFSLMDCST